MDSDSIPPSTSTFYLPKLEPPNDGLIAILHCPPSALLHQPCTLKLTVQNRQKARTADLFLQVESSEAFVLAGPRQTRLPTLLPGTSEDIYYNAIPLLCGRVKLPTFKIHDRRRIGPVQREDTTRDDDGAVESATLVQVVMHGDGNTVIEGDDEDTAKYLLVYPA